MTPEQSAALRKPFDDAQVGRLARSGGVDYIGHSVVTDRLLEVDPGWFWEPMGVTDSGIPAIDMRHMGKKTRTNNGNTEEYDLFEASMWIKLTICGVTRLGVGSTLVYPWSEGFEKMLESDALKRAAMRFGVALTLWSKEELESEVEPPPVPVQTITEEQVTAIKELFDSIEGEDGQGRPLKRLAMVEFAKSQPIPIPDTPASDYSSLYTAACQNLLDFQSTWQMGDGGEEE